MKIIVTGGFGFLGTHVTAVLQQAGHEVVPCSRQSGVDLRDRERASQFFGDQQADFVVHCAAHVGGIAYNELHPVEIFNDNIEIGQGLLYAMESAGIRNLINVMPNCTYPGGKTLYVEEEWWDGAIHPSVLAYGFPRKLLWGLTRAHAKKWGLRSIHLIFPNMYGIGDHFDPVRSHALGALIGKIITAKQVGTPEAVIWGTGKPVREWLYVEDGSQAINRVLERFESVCQIEDGVLNIGVGKGISITDMAETIKRYVGWNGRFIYDTNRPDGDMIKRMDATRMRQILDWTPPTPFAGGVAKTVQARMRR